MVAACALASAALGVAARVSGPDGSLIERVIVAAPVAAGFVVVWTLAIGLAGLAGNVAVLAAGPIVAWGAVRRLVRGPVPSFTAELLERWNRASRMQRVAVLAAAGAVAGLIVEVAVEPGFDIDPLTYHLVDVFGWLHSGHAGTAQTYEYDLPLGYYPVTNEILLTWVLGISRSFAPLAVWSTGIALLGLLAFWRLLELLRVPRTVAGAGLTAFATLPIFIIGLNLDGPGTDLPAITWLACTAALSAGAARRPALLAPALLAAGLGVGTKTTVGPLAAVALLAGVWSARSSLRPARAWLAAGAAGGLLVGAPWYVRNTLTHGWPLWPFESGPTGDPIPRTMRLFSESFLSRPVTSVKVIGTGYLDWLGGALGLLAGALAVPLISRSRAALLAAALAVAAALVWTAAPYTGVSHVAAFQPLAVGTVRYLLAALGACVVALAVAARDSAPLGRWLVIAVFAAVTVGSLVADAHFGWPLLPRVKYLLIGCAVGAVIGAVAGGMRLPAIPSLWRVAVPVAAVAGLALAAPGWLWREGGDGSYASPLLAFMMTQPEFRSGSEPISFAPSVVATLAGPRLAHPLALIPARESCARVRARLRPGWVVVVPRALLPGITTLGDAAYCLRQDHPIYDYLGVLLVYGPTR